MSNKDKKNAQELVTIGLTCYNAVDTIERAINSAINQDWLNTEIIIVDDYSTDGSINKILSIISSHKNIHLIRHEKNLGRASARNTIINNANGDFIAFYDDDDESFSERISEQVKKIKSHEKNTGAEYITCCASGIRCYSNGYEVLMPAIGSREIIPKGKGLADYLLFYKKQPGWFYGGGVPTCSLMARTNVFDAVQGFEEGMRSVEDADLAIRLAFIGCHFIGTEKILFKQYVTFSNDKSAEINLHDEQQLAEKNKAYLKSINRYYYAKQWPKLRYYHFKRKYVPFVLLFFQLLARYPYAVIMHFLATAPKRFIHERRINKDVLE